MKVSVTRFFKIHCAFYKIIIIDERLILFLDGNIFNTPVLLEVVQSPCYYIQLFKLE